MPACGVPFSDLLDERIPGHEWFTPFTETFPLAGETGHFVLRLCPAIKGNKFCSTTRVHCIGDEIFHCHKQLANGQWIGDCLICKKHEELSLCLPNTFDVLSEIAKGKVADRPRGYCGSSDDFRRDVDSIKPFEQYYFNVIARGEEKLGPLKWHCDRAIYKQIIEGIVGNPSNPNVPKLGDVTDRNKGHDITIKWGVSVGYFRYDRSSGYTNGQWRTTRRPFYTGFQFLPASKLGTPRQLKFWATQLHDLTKLRNLAPKEEMLEALEGIFGYLGTIREKQIYRSLSDPFVPAW